MISELTILKEERKETYELKWDTDLSDLITSQ